MTTTWAGITGRRRSVTATCTTGSESAPSTPAKAAQTVAFASAVAGNTVTIRDLTFTAIANGSTPASTLEFSVGASNTACGDNFAAAVNANTGRLGVTALNAAGTVTLTAVDYGTAGNAINLSKVGAPITVGGATFANGVDFFGVNLQDVGAIQVVAQAGSGQTIASGSLKAYFWDVDCPAAVGVPDLDLAISATTARGYGFIGPSAGLGTPVIAARGYLGWVPSGVTISAGSMVIEMLAVDSMGRAV